MVGGGGCIAHVDPENPPTHVHENPTPEAVGEHVPLLRHGADEHVMLLGALLGALLGVAEEGASVHVPQCAGHALLVMAAHPSNATVCLQPAGSGPRPGQTGVG